MSSQRLLLFHFSCQLQVLDHFDQVLFAKLSAARSTLFLEKAESQEDLSQRAAGWPVPSTRSRAGLAPQKADHGLSLTLPPLLSQPQPSPTSYPYVRSLAEGRIGLQD